MKALSIRQPWVHAILREGKDIENRSWKTDYRGWLAIHASGRPERNAVFPRGILRPELDTLEYSAVCGVARIVEVVTESRSKWFLHADEGSTNYGWVLSSPTPLRTPIACMGRLGLWDVPPRIAEEIQRQLPRLKLGE
jgi:hypothetical protein